MSVGAPVGVLIPHPDPPGRARVPAADAEALASELLAAADAAMYEAKHSGDGLRTVDATPDAPWCWPAGVASSQVRVSVDATLCIR